MPILPIMLFLLSNPALVAKGVEAVLIAVEKAMAAYRRWQAGLMTDEELKAAWAAEGLLIDEANAEWLKKHPA